MSSSWLENRSSFQNPDHSVVLADIDDVTVTLSLIVPGVQKKILTFDLI